MSPDTSRVRVYVATSIDGFIAGESDDLSWLPSPASDGVPESGALSYEVFMADVGALLMGRRTYDVVRGFDVKWPYGDRPVLVASHRDLDDEAPGGVRRVEGSIESLVAEAKEAAAGRDVYVDGGVVIRQACTANLVDELVITVAPVALGSGHSLFGGLEGTYEMEIVNTFRFPGGMLQLQLVPTPRTQSDSAT